jgi:uncharacterized protein YjbJ (UPF0337 family)
MNDKRSPNAAARAKASVTEAIGKLTGDKAVEEEGAAQKRVADSEAARLSLKGKPQKPT